MSQLIDFDCPRCGETQELSWHSRKVCVTCRMREQRDIARGIRGRAWRIVTKAIKAGTIIPGTCEVCGISKVDAHHDDYAKPLEVRWLCRTHHKQHHAQHGPGLNSFSVEEAQ